MSSSAAPKRSSRASCAWVLSKKTSAVKAKFSSKSRGGFRVLFSAGFVSVHKLLVSQNRVFCLSLFRYVFSVRVVILFSDLHPSLNLCILSS